ncbi:MAG: hypothetical protein CM1200mP36_06740 [Gammaproteobacteria bacterium]|nr:MAG: hypothetical protein CM1200mP36_06740 [Gammaproteobacteria bacterium]
MPTITAFLQLLPKGVTPPNVIDRPMLAFTRLSRVMDERWSVM